MKIRIGGYRITNIAKRDTRLSIRIDISTEKGDTIRTSATIQLVPISYFHGKIAEEAFGLLFLSAIVYTIDRAIDRHKYSVDGWSREFDVDIEIPAHLKFKENQSIINRMLSFLTGDYWDCKFIAEASIKYPLFKPTSFYDDISQVTLFSGGMDSLIGAIDYLSTNPNRVLYLSSHYDRYMSGPKSDQIRVREILKKKFGNTIKYSDSVMISPDLSVEMSCRSRSLMFLALATIHASYAKCGVIIPENGSVSLNFPLSPSRRASCSTRTTHPLFVSRYQMLLNSLGIAVNVSNPYEFCTKGEMVQNCADKDFLLKIIPTSNSCGKRNMHQQMYDNTKATHCSHCMPCMYRKAALVGEIDGTTYGNRLETIFQKRSNAISNDFIALLDFLKTPFSLDEIRKELYVGGMGSMGNIDQYVDLVIRTRAELSKMVKAEDSSLINKYMGWA